MPMNISTTYLGLPLAHPFVLGASPLSEDLDALRRVEDAGCAAVVVHSLFEEQITALQSGRIHHMDPLDEQFAPVLAHFPPPERWHTGPDEYLGHLRRIKAALRIPVIASLNGTTPESWLAFAALVEQAGADALELNMYDIVSDPNESAASVERSLRNVVAELKDQLKIPIAVKLSPYFTAFGNFAQALDRAGADGLVLFNRFCQPDIDIGAMAVVPCVELSTSAELLLRLRWIAHLHGRVRASLAVTGGVATPGDAVKALLVGAHAVQIVSAVLRHGPTCFSVMREQLERWMAAQGFSSIDEFRGRLDLSHSPNPAAFERAGYLRSLSAWNRQRVPM